ncbi:hypothetical protein NDU88_000314 [Pleurodeles waltl]|uniref:Uncharacterized protein n=1 Tax=Pleurodeles waltl TaxID=8319 RepID=A0AAV7VVR4_PLEWA|nr:hypothetical protein NDU88_000314 [Pleurodeles waltl]
MGPCPSSKAIRDPTVATTAPGGSQDPDRPHCSCFTVQGCRQYVAVHRSPQLFRCRRAYLSRVHLSTRLGPPQSAPCRSTAALQVPPRTFEPQSPQCLQPLFRSADHTANLLARLSDPCRLLYGAHSSGGHTTQLRIRWEASPPLVGLRGPPATDITRI